MSRHTNLTTTGDAPLSVRGRSFLFVRIVAAAIAAFVMSFVWYMAFSPVIIALHGAEPDAASDTAMHGWLMSAELLRNVVLASVLAHLVLINHVHGLRRAVKLSVILWVGFPVVLLAGSVMWENVPWLLAAIHSGDWLIKLMVMIAILCLGRTHEAGPVVTQHASREC